jgi:hypothetical protein
MRTRYIGGVVSNTAPVTTGPAQTGQASGMWTLTQQMKLKQANKWPTS